MGIAVIVTGSTRASMLVGLSAKAGAMRRLTPKATATAAGLRQTLGEGNGTLM
ncbi:MAG: hypothetical protein ACLQF1_08280 [Methyloceanibacter sp.]|jgi:hypothetical protein